MRGWRMRVCVAIYSIRAFESADMSNRKSSPRLTDGRVRDFSAACVAKYGKFSSKIDAIVNFNFGDGDVAVKGIFS